MQPVDVTGGESVYCINRTQLAEAFRLAEEDTASARRIAAALESVAKELSRNEQAALAFVLIDKLLKSSPPTP